MLGDTFDNTRFRGLASRGGLRAPPGGDPLGDKEIVSASRLDGNHPVHERGRIIPPGGIMGGCGCTVWESGQSYGGLYCPVSWAVGRHGPFGEGGGPRGGGALKGSGAFLSLLLPLFILREGTLMWGVRGICTAWHSPPPVACPRGCILHAMPGWHLHTPCQDRGQDACVVPDQGGAECPPLPHAALRDRGACGKAGWGYGAPS